MPFRFLCFNSQKKRKNKVRKQKRKGCIKIKKEKAPILRLPARASVWYTSASFISRGITFLSTPLFTRLLSGTDYGVYPLYVGWMALFSVVSTLEIGGSVLYGGFVKFKGAENDFTKSALITLLGVFTVLLIPALVLIRPLSHLSGLPVILLYVMALHIIAEAVGSLFSSRWRYFYSYKKVFAANVIPSVTAPLIALVIISITPPYARSLGAAISAVFAAAVIFLISRKALGKAQGKMVGYVLKCSALFMPQLLFSAVISNADKLLISRKFGSSALAKYSVAHSLGLALTFFTVGIYGALKPWIIRKLSRGDRDGVAKTTASLFGLSCIFSVALAALAPELFSLLAPKEYFGAIGAVYVFTLTVLPMLLSGVMSVIFIQREKVWLISVITALAAVFNIALNLILLERFSYTAAAFSALAAQLFITLAEWFILGKSVIGGNMIWGRFAFCSLAVFALYFLREYPILRIIALPCLIPFAYRTSRKLFRLIKEVKADAG